VAELVHTDLPAAVLARFADSVAAQAAIDAALVAARRYVGWHVSPVKSETIELDGPGGRVLSLPTLNLTAVTEVTELGEAVDLDSVDWSRRKGTITKRYGRWSGRDGSIEATVTHGFTEAEAADWRSAIVKLVDEGSQSSDRTSADMKRWKVDDVEYEWFEALVSANDELAAKFSQFRILPSP